MTSPISHTAHGDAPLSAAKNPSPQPGLGHQAELGEPARGDVLVGRSVTINRPREELYAFWRDFTNLPRFMRSVHSVAIKDVTHSHWVIEAPAGKTVEWDSEVTILVGESRGDRLRGPASATAGKWSFSTLPMAGGP